MFNLLIEETVRIWVAGGWLMIPLTILCGIIYKSVFSLYFELRQQRFLAADQNRWAHWIDVPAEAEGELGSIIRHTCANVESEADLRRRFSEVRTTLIPDYSTRIRTATILVSAAPLTGLLGTVTGMLSTFAGLSISTAGNTIDLVAGGISEALITTQTGLVMAIPAYVLISRITRYRDDLELFLVKAENLAVQAYSRRKAA